MKSKDLKDELRKRAEVFDWSRVDAMTDEEVTVAAKSDPDAHPVPASWFKRAAQRRAARKAAAE